MQSDESQQRAVCRRLNVRPEAPSGIHKVGIALATLESQPLNGLRHQPEEGTSGWFLWGGNKLSDAPEFFQPLHVSHLLTECPQAIPYLALPPGWRFLLAPNFEDIWFDPKLLEL